MPELSITDDEAADLVATLAALGLPAPQRALLDAIITIALDATSVGEDAAATGVGEDAAATGVGEGAAATSAGEGAPATSVDFDAQFAHSFQPGQAAMIMQYHHASTATLISRSFGTHTMVTRLISR